jgi:succinate dehydrogenase/fumarate reductase flavoprotein subunit|tara:strand:- start:13 stop:393 length:381 start_codon:yes stop_codon:yes gene_type:complete
MATQILPKRSETSLAIPTTSDLAVGEIAMNIADGKFFTRTSGNVIKEMGGAGAVTLQDVTTSGATTNNDITLDGADIIFEGALANAFETTLTVAEPTADRVVTLPDQSGTLAMDGDALAYGIVFGG